MPGCHRNGPFSRKKPARELHPGPPFSQSVICPCSVYVPEGKERFGLTSSEAAGLSEGKNQKKRLESPDGELARFPA